MNQRMSQAPPPSRRRAFTLIEVMIVLAIIVAMGGIVAVALFQRQKQADVRITRISLKSIESAIEFFRMDYRRFPFEQEGLAVLWDKEMLDPDSDESVWTAYLKKKLDKDAWGSEWGYREESELIEGTYDLWSNGPDGEEGTDDDIMLRESDEEGEFGFSEPGGG